VEARRASVATADVIAQTDAIMWDAIGIVVVGGAVLIFALRFGFIGGGGAGAYRTKNPFNFWLGVGTTGVLVFIAVIVLILMSVGVMRSESHALCLLSTHCRH
jgi:uncharacterized spore protein YtfJ